MSDTSSFTPASPTGIPETPPTPATVSSPRSVLDTILAQANGWEPANLGMPEPQEMSMVTSGENGVTPITPPTPPSIIKKPLSYGLLLKFLASVFLVALIFFGSFLAYIVFNPSQAQFFMKFEINPNDVALLLQQLINYVFGVLILLISILWIFLLFRAIWTSRDLRRLRLTRWLIAIVTGIILFSSITLWTVLIQTINATDYSNPSGLILLYDQDLYSQEDTRSISELGRSTELIGPIRILFDISANAKRVSEKNLVSIESYHINFDGAKCSDGSSTVDGTNTGDKTIICTFDSIKRYQPVWTYTVRDGSGKPEELDMSFPSIEVRGLVSIKKSKNLKDEWVTTYDASGLRSIGSPIWQFVEPKGENGKELKDIAVSSVEDSKIHYLYLKVTGSGCDRVFVIGSSQKQMDIGRISTLIDPKSPLLYHFDIEWLTLDQNEITAVEWTMNNSSIICRDQQIACSYSFSDYGKKTIKVHITTARGEDYTIETTINIEKPLRLLRHVKVYNADGEFLNPESVFDTALKAYVIKDINFPNTIQLDAKDIVPEDSGYRFEWVEWTITTTKGKEIKKGNTLSVNLVEASRYTITAKYTFSTLDDTGKEKSMTGQDIVIIDTNNRDLIPILSVTQSSDYLPAIVHLDASASRSMNSEIKKFLFDFGEGKPVVEGDAQQDYEYLTAGEKTITLTVVDANGNKESSQKKIVIKELQKTVDFMPSMAPWAVGVEIDWEPQGITGQIDEYIWNFGDGTPTVRTQSASHAFQKAGNYTVSLTIRYSDGTIKSQKKEFRVE